MSHPLVQAFFREVAEMEARTPEAQQLERYQALLEQHFHAVDLQRTTIPLWPCNTNLVPAPFLRSAVGPVAYRYYFFSQAEAFFLIRHLCGFTGDQHLLDVGCGCGKTALALLRLIRPPGSYTGFDIQPHLIEFLNRFFRERHLDGHFRADCFDIRGSQLYRGSQSGVAAEEFHFPYPDGHFDCIVLFSVFTHLRTAALTNYARNLARVARPGGRILVSAFLLDNAPDAGTGGAPWTDSPRRQGLVKSVDPADQGHLKVGRLDLPEYVVAYRLQFLTDLFASLGCRLTGEPLYGSWSGRSDFVCHQDVVVFRKDC
jgi:SAM-dependent methyltransferase